MNPVCHFPTRWRKNYSVPTFAILVQHAGLRSRFLKSKIDKYTVGIKSLFCYDGQEAVILNDNLEWVTFPMIVKHLTGFQFFEFIVFMCDIPGNMFNVRIIFLVYCHVLSYEKTSDFFFFASCHSGCESNKFTILRRGSDRIWWSGFQKWFSATLSR